MQHEQMWSKCLTVIKDNIGESAFRTWFAQIVPLKYEREVLVLQVPSQFFVEYIEEKYIDLLRMTIHRIIGAGTKLEYRVLIDKSSNSGTQIPSNMEQPKPAHNAKVALKNPYEKFVLPEIDPQLNFSYNFNNLIEGSSNKLAHAAGQSIARKPGKTTFNPLFVSGQSGVGKTHLANAIGVMCKQLHPAKRVLYVSANTFQIQYTDAVRNNTVNDFLNFYQTIEVLIIDDVQELEGKTATQNTFFHIFNHLHQNGKQLVLTSDRPPMALKNLEQRLLTRFKWGLGAEMGKPDFEMRKAILESKIYSNGLQIPDTIVDYIAENVTDNVRDLEGALISILAHSTLENKKLDLELAREIVSRITSVTLRITTIEQIRDTVCKHYALSVEAISTKSRKREVVQARQVAMYLSKKMTQNSLAAIGLAIGKRNHATVLHACKTVKEQMEIDKHFCTEVNGIEGMVKNSG
ncbi:MAG: chromosomal replication initiator protein DnaA [Prevotellaceae bacterium]|nr:chromosomal replication initiator protein DnaA [Prevotellaceae bacterium]